MKHDAKIKANASSFNTDLSFNTQSILILLMVGGCFLFNEIIV